MMGTLRFQHSIRRDCWLGLRSNVRFAREAFDRLRRSGRPVAVAIALTVRPRESQPIAETIQMLQATERVLSVRGERGPHIITGGCELPDDRRPPSTFR